MMIFSQRLKELRLEKGITQREMAQSLKLSPSKISHLMNGREPDYDTLCEIADFFHVTTDYLLGRSDYADHLEELQDLEIKRSIVQKEVEHLVDEKIELNLKDIRSLADDLSGILDSLALMNHPGLWRFINLTEHMINILYCLYKNKDLIFYDTSIPDLLGSGIDLDELYWLSNEFEITKKTISKLMLELLYYILESGKYSKEDRDTAKSIIMGEHDTATCKEISAYERCNPLNDVTANLIKQRKEEFKSTAPNAT